ncbi:hypothetical protein [Tautonia plasticadhaerens]|uniref:Lipoprotein n=1 Tax=Tautonia plasticadhaerens TaxID=2527974 RepID=A0A518GWF8_9BACT|nr:hypothetical protein [Tautonia plasticadhaerens]QDV32918.1 hypothetical protein ElP_07600 [Tautonia plasticadhaerens]
MPTGPESPRAAIASHRALAFALLSALVAAGCGGTRAGDTVEVEAEQQREMNKLLTDDYNQMYRERYTGGQDTPK